MGLHLFYRRIGIQVNGQGAIVNVSDVFEGNQVAILSKVKEFALCWVIKLNVFTFLVTLGVKIVRTDLAYNASKHREVP